MKKHYQRLLQNWPQTKLNRHYSRLIRLDVITIIISMLICAQCGIPVTKKIAMKDHSEWIASQLHVYNDSLASSLEYSLWYALEDGSKFAITRKETVLYIAIPYPGRAGDSCIAIHSWINDTLRVRSKVVHSMLTDMFDRIYSCDSVSISERASIVIDVSNALVPIKIESIPVFPKTMTFAPTKNTRTKEYGKE